MDIRIRDVDPVLHKAFKMKCVEQGESIQKAVLRLIKEYLEGEKDETNRL